jgi:hypothetical protein
MKKFRLILMLFALLLSTISTFAQGELKGYFRAKNLGSGNYGEVRGRATADVSVTNDAKFTKPGTVLYLMGNLETGGNYLMQNIRSQGIDVVGSDATFKPTGDPTNTIAAMLYAVSEYASPFEIYNGYITYMKYALLHVFIPFADAQTRAHIADGSATLTGTYATKTAAENQAIFDALMTDFNTNYVPQLKLEIRLIPTGGANTYYVRSQVPSLAPIKNFYLANKDAMDGLVIPCVRAEILQHFTHTGETLTTEEAQIMETLGYNPTDADIKAVAAGTTASMELPFNRILSDESLMFYWLKLCTYKIMKGQYTLTATSPYSIIMPKIQQVLNTPAVQGYFTEIHYNTPYFLIEGYYKDASGNRTYTAGTNLGFANDGTNSAYNDLALAGDHGKWVLEPVDETNYFAVTPIAHQARNGNYFASTYLDFPFELAGTDCVAAYTTDNTIQTRTSDGAKYVTFTKVSGTVPAGTPVVIECKSSAVTSAIRLNPVVGTRSTIATDAFMQGTYLGGEKSELASKWGVGVTSSDDLYLFGYNSADTQNPYGFYLYSSTTIPGNKPFLLPGNASNAAKVYVIIGDEDEATGISNIVTDENSKNESIYDLQGRKVQNTNLKGIYIVNGKKVIK